ncbi:hypothetical protein N0V83_004623 [Neocucurbitaria cava]|uniref:C3H1-type domain-containing protein n=1 Tax=Neocucurbitaria cava TaxID=798079 RepID=A0A9W8YB09_9PLEO|nr:hypothetical protein N0V83_004623 [Neocucurbitaria cava]
MALPFHLHGVPRQLSHRQMSEEGWKYLMETDEAPSTIPVQAPTALSSPLPVAKPQFRAPDHHVRHDSPLPQAEAAAAGPFLPAAAENVSEPARSPSVALSNNSPSLTDSFASIYQKDAQRLGYRTSYPSGIAPDPAKKEYCTHWIKTGECAFISIGCKFKHEMPTTEKLRELGFTQGMPRWWKEKSAVAVRGPTWMQRRLAHGNEDEEQPALRSFLDPSTFTNNRTEGCGIVQGSIPHHEDRLRMELGTGTTITQREALPLVSAQALSQPASRLPDLLIDLDETPAPPPPSLHSSDSSSVSDESSGTHISSRAFRSPTLSPVAKSSPSVFVGDADLKTESKQKGREPAAGPHLRRYSQISWASESSEEEVEPDKPLLEKPKSVSHKPTRRPTAPAKQHGLANSKHATTQGKRAEHTSRSGNRRQTQPKPNEITLPELHSKIEQLHRAVHRKEKVKKGTSNNEGRGQAIRSTDSLTRRKLSK